MNRSLQIIWEPNRVKQRLASLGNQRERGASLVEYAFIALIFLSLIFGISGFGHAVFVYHHINNAAKEATRYAAVRGATCSTDNSCVASNSASGITGQTTIADVEAYVASITPTSIDATKFTYNICGVKDSTVCAGSPPICSTVVGGAGPLPKGSPSCIAEVQITYPYSFVFPLIRNTTFNMSSDSQMIIAH